MKGFFHDPSADPAQYVFGSTSPIVAAPIQENRDWRPWRPDVEIQTKNGYDPLSCASYGSLNLIEIYLYRVYGVKKNYSDRWLAVKTGTFEKNGNDPHYVLEYIRRYGIVEESKWPFSDDLGTRQEYYIEPDPILDDIAADFNKDYKLLHDTVRVTDEFPTIAEAMWAALQHSILGVSVGFNQVDEKGRWFKNGNGPDYHFCIVDNAEKDEHFGIFDSALNADKQAAWDKFRPELVKRINITKRTNEAEISRLMKMVTYLAEVLRLTILLNALKARQTQPAAPSATTTPDTAQEPSTPEPTLLDVFCKGIQKHEGWKKGSRSYRNNNPGNCRFSRVGYHSKYFPVFEDRAGIKPGKQGFAIFKDYETGWLYLQNLVREKIAKHKDWTILQFIADEKDGWAPASDGNDPLRYAHVLADAIGKDIDTFRIKQLV